MTVEIERRGACAVVWLRGGKANSLNLRLFDALLGALDELRDVPALVLTAEGSSFSAGLALPELIELDRAGMARVIDMLGVVTRRLLTFPGATVAAINGHAIAGGCVLALMCDVRMMSGGRIGLNEVPLGLGLPASVVEPLRIRVSPRVLVEIALEGKLFEPAEAKRVGLVDDIEEPAALLERAVARATTLGGSPLAYAMVKRALLEPVLEAIDRRQLADREAWLDTWFSDHAQRTLRAAVERITKR